MTEPTFTFDPHLLPEQITLVGCGGTGAQWARGIARLAYKLKSENKRVPEITFIDPDVVEMKNVGRQLFSMSEIGQAKATVLGRRFNYGYGLDIHCIVAPVSVDHLSGSDRRNIVCGAVDNAAARQVIAAAKPSLWIDSGNHTTTNSGQVIIGNTDDSEVLGREWDRADGVCRYLPYPSVIFPALLEPDETDTAHLSCADLTAANQHPLINDFMGAIATRYLAKILLREPVQSSATFVDIDTLTMRSVPITRANTEAYCA